jgi:divalent metal cation (Fe/Co/Zn/Cd) transporter
MDIILAIGKILAVCIMVLIVKIALDMLESWIARIMRIRSEREQVERIRERFRRGL